MISRNGALLAALCLVAMVVAGCASKEPTADAGLHTGKTEQTILDPSADDGEVAGASQTVAGGKAEAAPGNGEIRGLVYDDAGLQVQDALVSLIGSEESATTDAKGAFRFTNITSGEHTLRVTPGEVFRVHEGVVDVEPGRVTLVTITLVPKDGRGPGYRPHLHDYWGDRTELELFDLHHDYGASTYTLYGPGGPVMAGVYGANQGVWSYFGIPDREDGVPPLVLPGTAQLRFTIAWDDSEVDADRFILGFHPGDHDWRDQAASGNGDEFTVDIAGEDADNGHQMFSLWQFRIKAEARTPPVTVLGPLQVRAVLIKGDLPVDPPHEDFWGGNTTYLARSMDTAMQAMSACCVEGHVKATPDSKRLIPPGTASLDLRLKITLTQNGQAAPDDGWQLLAKPADVRPGAPDTDYVLLEPTSETPGLKTYTMPVTGSQTDAFYQADSNWVFIVREEVIDPPYGVREYPHRFYLEVIANKDPAYV